MHTGQGLWGRDAGACPGRGERTQARQANQHGVTPPHTRGQSHDTWDTRRPQSPQSTPRPGPTNQGPMCKGFPPPATWGGGPRGPSPKTRCESAARARHGVSPPEASSTTAVPPQHPGRRLASPSAPGGPPLAGAPRPPPTTPMSHSRPRGNKSPKAPTDDHPPHPTRTRRAQPSSPTPPRTGGHPRSTSPRDTRPATAARG